MKIFPFSFMIVGLLLNLLPAHANDCLDGYIKDADALLVYKDSIGYQLVLNTYEEAIKNCPLNNKQRTFVLDQLDAVHDSIKAEIDGERVKAVKAQAVAERAKELADSLRTVAEKETKLKILEAFRAEARRLAFLAKEEKNVETKLFLAFKAHQLMDSSQSILPTVLKVFGDAIRDNYSIAHKENSTTVNDAYLSARSVVIANKNLLYFPGRESKLAADDMHQDHINGIRPFKEKLITYSKDNYLKIWNHSGQLLNTLKGHTAAVNFLELSPKQDFMLSGGKDQKAILWNMEGEDLNVLEHEGIVYEGEFALNHTSFFTRDGNNTVHLWTKDGEKIKSLKHKYYVYDALFLMQGQYLVTGTAEGTTQFWDEKGDLLDSFSHANGSPVVQLIASPDQEHFITLYADGSGVIRKGMDKVILELDPLSTSTFAQSQQQPLIQKAIFAPSQSQVLLQSGNEVHLINYDGTTLAEFAHIKEISQMRFSSDGQYILTASKDNSAKLWDSQGKLLLHLNDFQQPVMDAKFAADEKSIVAYSSDGKLVVCPIPRLKYLDLINNPPELEEETKKTLGVK